MRLFTTSSFLVPELKPNLKYFMRLIFLGLQKELLSYLEKSQSILLYKILVTCSFRGFRNGWLDVSARPMVLHSPPLSWPPLVPAVGNSLMKSAKMNLTVEHPIWLCPGPSCVKWGLTVQDVLLWNKDEIFAFVLFYSALFGVSLS